MSEIFGTWLKRKDAFKEMQVVAWAVVHVNTGGIRSIWDNETEAAFAATTGLPGQYLAVPLIGQYTRENGT